MVRLICADLSQLGGADYESLYRAASPERQKRADRYLRHGDALRCVAADALLRYALGTDRYTIETASSGKPRVREHPDFHFNLSHAGDWVVIACADGPVGVDVEQHSTNTDWRSIARQFFSDGEQRLLEQAADPFRRFYEIWTGKESYLKYLGTGLTRDLRSFSVGDLEEGVNLYSPELSEGYSLSLCTMDKVYSLELLDGQRLQ